jgi:hypothetical protein
VADHIRGASKTPVAQTTAGPSTTKYNMSVRAVPDSPAQLSRSVADAITRVNPDLTLTFQPLAERINASLSQERIVAMLSGFFGAFAILLAGLGLYGVTSYPSRVNGAGSASGRRSAARPAAWSAPCSRA